jgi:hypothetical protein
MNQRKRRYVINLHGDEFLFNNNLNSYLHIVDLSEPSFTRSSIHYAFYHQANLTYYNIHFDQPTSDLMISLLALYESKLSSPQTFCTNTLRIIKGNFIQVKKALHLN